MVIELINDKDAIEKMDFLPYELMQKALSSEASILGGFEQDQLIVIGEFSYVKNYNKTIHIDYIYVLEKCRGKGIGKTYLKLVEETFKKLGVDRIIFEYAGNFDEAEAWEHFVSHIGYKPLSERPVESLWDYFSPAENFNIKQKSIKQIGEREKIKICNEENVNQILKENPVLSTYLSKQGLSLTDASLVYEEQGKVLAALVVKKTEEYMILLGTFGADKAHGMQTNAIIAMLKYLNEICDFDNNELSFRIENFVVEKSLECLLREKDIERAYVLSAKEV